MQDMLVMILYASLFFFCIGFGDSGGIATADKIQHDMETVYRWAKERTKNSEVYIWGHSLGTG